MIRILDAGESRLALLHKGEMILSKADVQKLIEVTKEPKNITQNINITITNSPELNREAIANKISDRLMEEIKRRGIRSV